MCLVFYTHASESYRRRLRSLLSLVLVFRWWSLRALYFTRMPVRVTVDDSGLCCHLYLCSGGGVYVPCILHACQ